VVHLYGTPRVPPGFVRRPRVTAKLGADAVRVVVRGSAGSGKTVAVAEWAAGQHGRQGAWLPVDDGTASRLSFWQALTQLLLDAGLVVADTILARSLYSSDAARDPRALLRRAFPQLPTDLTIVVDNCHKLTDPLLHGDVTELLGNSPNFRLIAITRTQGPRESPAVQRALAPIILQEQDLAFTGDEIAEALELADIRTTSGNSGMNSRRRPIGIRSSLAASSSPSNGGHRVRQSGAA
jgi:LuxR family transcriptional regulator, maltose regulon positive regulatory protein